MTRDGQLYTIIESDVSQAPNAGQTIRFRNEEEGRLLEAEYVESREPHESDRYDLGELGRKRGFSEKAHFFEVYKPSSDMESVGLEVHEVDVHFGRKELAQSIDERYEELV